VGKRVIKWGLPYKHPDFRPRGLGNLPNGNQACHTIVIKAGLNQIFSPAVAEREGGLKYGTTSTFLIYLNYSFMQA